MQELNQSPTTIQVPMYVRDNIKQAATRRARKMGITKLSMIDYLNLIATQE